jgi:hypothetical protein
MILDPHFPETIKVAIANWVDVYTVRLDQHLNAAWPALAASLEKGIDSMSWHELAFGPGEDFLKRCIQPAVECWVECHVQPIVEEAVAELKKLIPGGQGSFRAKGPMDLDRRGNLRFGDVLEVLTLPGGILVAGGAVTMAIVTTTKWLIFTTVIVNWPLLIAGLVIGAALAIFGGSQLATLYEKLRRRFRDQLLPQIKAAVVGKGIDHKGQHVPSMLAQLKHKVRETARVAIASFGKQG